jgi:hypothetical protein
MLPDKIVRNQGDSDTRWICHRLIFHLLPAAKIEVPIRMGEMPIPAWMLMPIIPLLFSPLHAVVSPRLQAPGFDQQAPGKIWSGEEEGVDR